MRYLSVCSGIEAASVAWHGLGWQPLAFSEIEPFPRAVLAHHYPGVPCHGDFTKLRDEAWIENADVLVGGTPCQAFSVAGLRKSLDDDRGNLTLEFVRLANAIDDARSTAGRDAAIIVWENVPGVLSVRDNAFGCFLGALAGENTPLVPTGGKWTDFGVVIGPRRRLAWRVLDAQYFGLAQRRRRVFVVASARDGFDPVQVLSQPHGVQRYSAPRREAKEGLAQSVTSGPPFSRTGNDRVEADAIIAGKRSHWDGDFPHPSLTQSHNTGGVGQSNQELFSQRGAYLAPAQIPSTGDLSHCLNAGSMGRQDYETETLIAHSLRASQGGGDKPHVLASINHGELNACSQEAYAAATLRALRGAVGEEAFAEWRSRILDTLQSPEVLRAFLHGCGVRRAAREARRWVDDGALSRPQDMPAGALLTLWQDGPDGRSPQGRELAQQLAGQLGQTLPLLPSQGTPAMAVRRLTPKEAERLQGFPDNYTAIPWRNKPASECPDGPRYKALGNSMAVPVMRWIGQRIAAELARNESTSQMEPAA